MKLRQGTKVLMRAGECGLEEWRGQGGYKTPANETMRESKK